MRRVPQQHCNPRVRRERDWRALRRQIVLLAGGLTMACGFVAAVGQHYAAVRYGYESERLREERKQLLAERDRLLLELNEAESPVTLERAARALGMQPARPSQIGGARKRRGDGQEDAAAATAYERGGTTKTRAEVKGTRAHRAGARAGASSERGAATGGRTPTPRVDSRPRVVEASGPSGL